MQTWQEDYVEGTQICVLEVCGGGMAEIPEEWFQEGYSW